MLHVSTIALPPGLGDFASGAVDKLGPDDALIVLFEYDPASVDQPLFKAAGLPKVLTDGDFSPNVLQRAIRGQAGVQRFFHDAGRAFCLYVVLGSFAHRRRAGAGGERGPRHPHHRPARRHRRADDGFDHDRTVPPPRAPTTDAPTAEPTTVEPTTTTPDAGGSTP